MFGGHPSGPDLEVVGYVDLGLRGGGGLGWEICCYCWNCVRVGGYQSNKSSLSSSFTLLMTA